MSRAGHWQVLVVLAVAYIAAPVVLSDFWLLVLDYAGVAAVGALGLNLLTGYAGQVSLGHAFFIATGAYVAACAARADLPLAVWLPLSALVGALIGALVGPFALRLRGDYLAIVTLGLVFLGNHVFDNWRWLTGGAAGTTTAAPARFGPLDFATLHIVGTAWSRTQGLFWLVWGVVALVGAAVGNLARTRPGRALRAVRDGEMAAEVMGISVGRYKVCAFALSSSLAAIAGGLYGLLQQYVSTSEWTLVLSISYVAMVIVGGLGSVPGSVIGALVITAFPRLIERYSAHVPGLAAGPGDPGLISSASLNVAIFGLMIVAFLVFEPKGLLAVWSRIASKVKAKKQAQASRLGGRGVVED